MLGGDGGVDPGVLNRVQHYIILGHMRGRHMYGNSKADSLVRREATEPEEGS